MSETRTILVATDFSPQARLAAERGAMLAEESGLTLTLLHVLPAGLLDELRLWLGDAHASEQALHVDVRQRLQDLAQELRTAYRVEVRTVHTIGTAVDDVLIEASTLDAPLVVVGSHGTGFLRHLVLGGTAERLVRRARRPVLVARGAAMASYHRALVALDFSTWSAQALIIARSVAPQAHLVLFNAFRVPFEERLHLAGLEPAAIERYRKRAEAEARERVDGMARAAGLARGSWKVCVVEGEPDRCILEQAREHRCDLVVLGKHGTSVAEELLLGSVTRQVLAQGTTDVLVSTERDPAREPSGTVDPS